MSNSCKRAASVILLGKSVFSNSSSKLSNGGEKCLSPFDYKILVVKRSPKSSFMPNGIVFPGGIYDEVDASRDWLKLFRESNMRSSLEFYPLSYNPSSMSKKIRKDNALSLISNGDYLPDHLAHRITAIRELFEECGLLLAKKYDSSDRDNISSGWASFLHSHEILQWQKRVHKDPREFIKLFEKFNCVPDIWGLNDWKIWLTPVHLPSKRFDTTFFVAALNQIPPTVQDSQELSELKWMAPDQLLDDYDSQKIWLPPPQFYELSRFAKNFHQAKQLVDYSNAWSGCPRWMPVGIKATDGWVYLLPGDEMYPEEPNFYDIEAHKKSWTSKSELSMAELRNKCSKIHRMELKDTYTVSIIISQYPTLDHVYPELKKHSNL